MKQKIVYLLSLILPNTFTRIAFNQLTNPQTHKLRDHELVTLDKSIKERIPFKSFEIQTYHWQGSGDKILLIHGWEGQAGNFSDLIEKLIELNYDIHAFDAPSHGLSSRGMTSLFDFTELTAERIQTLQAKKLVSHSFGGVATTYALLQNPSIEIEKYVLLTTPDKFTERIEEVSKKVGISKKVRSKLTARIELETGHSIDALNVSDFVKEIKVKEALILHDIDDKIIPFAQSQNVNNNWTEAKLETIKNTGHFRILRTESVLNRVISFLK
jgi:predicted alpha/beta hydrolase family esterase